MASTFPWWDAKVPAAGAAMSARKREAMYLREMEERAALLFRLRYPKDEARRRLRGNVLWDFELHRKPAFVDRADAIVAEVWKRGGRARGGAPSLE